MVLTPVVVEGAASRRARARGRGPRAPRPPTTAALLGSNVVTLSLTVAFLRLAGHPYVAKRRTANHPCPVCGKHYVNEGSLRKHLVCHPEASHFSGPLRMWPCNVCQSVFTHEQGETSRQSSPRFASQKPNANLSWVASVKAQQRVGGSSSGRDVFGRFYNLAVQVHHDSTSYHRSVFESVPVNIKVANAVSWSVLEGSH